MRQIETSTLSNQSLVTALLAHTYTADADRAIQFRMFADQVAGNGLYQAYVTIQRLGAGSAYTVEPICQAVVASGVTAVAFVTGIIAVKKTDVVKVYIVGLAADTTTPDVVTEVWDSEDHRLQPGWITTLHADGTVTETYGGVDEYERGTALLAAAAAAVSGESIYFGPGLYHLTEAVLEMPDGVNLFGPGMYKATISTIAAIGAGAMVKPGSNATVADFAILSEESSQAPIGYVRVTTPIEKLQSVPVNAVVRRVRVLGNSDGVYLNNQVALEATPASIQFYDCMIESKWDAVTVFGADCTDVVELYNCVTRCRGAYTGSFGFNGLASRGATAASTIRYVGGSISAYGGKVHNWCVDVSTSDNVTIELDGVTLCSASGGYDVKQSGGTITLRNCRYDTTKVSSTGGTFSAVNDVLTTPSQKLVTDASGNAYVVDSSGNAIAPAATALTNATWTDAKAGYIDAAISTMPTAAGIADAVLDEALAAHDTEDTLGNVLNDLVEESSGVYRLTAVALAGAPTGATASYTVSETTVGTSPTVNLTAQQYTRFGPFTITATAAQTGDSHRLMVYAADAPATILWSLTTADSEISVGGDGDLTLTITDTDAHTGTAGTWLYRLVNTTDDVEICRGALTIEEGPNVPAA